MLGMQRRLSTPFLVLLTLPATAMGFALSVQISALSWILSTEYGLDLHDIGLVWAAGPLAGIVGQVLIGILSDAVWFWGGRRRPFLIIGGTLAALMLLALPYIGLISSSSASTASWAWRSPWPSRSTSRSTSASTRPARSSPT